MKTLAKIECKELLYACLLFGSMLMLPMLSMNGRYTYILPGEEFADHTFMTFIMIGGIFGFLQLDWEALTGSLQYMRHRAISRRSFYWFRYLSGLIACALLVVISVCFHRLLYGWFSPHGPIADWDRIPSYIAFGVLVLASYSAAAWAACTRGTPWWRVGIAALACLSMATLSALLSRPDPSEWAKPLWLYVTVLAVCTVSFALAAAPGFQANSELDRPYPNRQVASQALCWCFVLSLLGTSFAAKSQKVVTEKVDSDAPNWGQAELQVGEEPVLATKFATYPDRIWSRTDEQGQPLTTAGEPSNKPQDLGDFESLHSPWMYRAIARSSRKAGSGSHPSRTPGYQTVFAIPGEEVIRHGTLQVFLDREAGWLDAFFMAGSGGSPARWRIQKPGDAGRTQPWSAGVEIVGFEKPEGSRPLLGDPVDGSITRVFIDEQGEVKTELVLPEQFYLGWKQAPGGESYVFTRDKAWTWDGERFAEAEVPAGYKQARVTLTELQDPLNYTVSTLDGRFSRKLSPVGARQNAYALWVKGMTLLRTPVLNWRAHLSDEPSELFARLTFHSSFFADPMIVAGRNRGLLIQQLVVLLVVGALLLRQRLAWGMPMGRVLFWCLTIAVFGIAGCVTLSLLERKRAWAKSQQKLERRALITARAA